MDTFYRKNGRTYVVEYEDEDAEPVEDTSDWPDDEKLDDPRRGLASELKNKR